MSARDMALHNLSKAERHTINDSLPTGTRVEIALVYAILDLADAVRGTAPTPETRENE